jgi:hypothetical protein
VSRIERGEAPGLSILQATRLAAVVGLDLAVRAYPAGSPIRDAAHRGLLERGRSHLPGGSAWHFEVPLPLSGDGRAWDAVVELSSGRVAIEAETRLGDIQSLQRRLALKRRDDPSIGAVVLLLSNTRHNRQVLREHGEAMRVGMPLDAAAVRAALSLGRVPSGDGIVVVDSGPGQAPGR